MIRMSKLSILGIVIIIAFIVLIFGRRLSFFRSSITGNGNVTTESRKVSTFTHLVLNGVFRTVISQDGGPEWVKVKADQNLQDMVVVSNDAETLEIGNKSGVNFTYPGNMVVYVNVKDLHKLTSKSVGKVETDGTIKSDELELKNDAVGKMSLNLDVQKLTAKLNSVGVTMLSGSASEADLNNQSIGKLEAYDLKAGKLTIKNNSVGAVEVYAEKEISIDHNGVGSLHYRGPANVVSLKDDGIGKVSKED